MEARTAATDGAGSEGAGRTEGMEGLEGTKGVIGGTKEGDAIQAMEVDAPSKDTVDRPPRFQVKKVSLSLSLSLAEGG